MKYILQTMAMAPRGLGEAIGRAVGELIDATPSRPWECDVEAVMREGLTQKERSRKRRYDKSYRARDVMDVDSVMLHITDVDGGFGVWRSYVEKHMSEGATYDEAKIEAQADRFAERSPYHAVDAVALVLAHHPRWWTPAGDGGNGNCVHFAIDKGSEEPLNVDKFQRRLHFSLERWRRMCPNLAWAVTHRQTSAMRGGDPGEDVCTAAAPVLRDVGISWRPGWVKGTGKPMPREWLL